MAEEDKKIVILLTIGILLLLSYYFPRDEEVPISNPVIEDVTDTSSQTEFLQPIEEVQDDFEVIA